LTRLSTGGLGSIGVDMACYRKWKRKENLPREKRICAVCGKEFECHPNKKKLTCDADCSEKYHRKKAAERAEARRLGQPSTANPRLSALAKLA